MMSRITAARMTKKTIQRSLLIFDHDTRGRSIPLGAEHATPSHDRIGTRGGTPRELTGEQEMWLFGKALVVAMFPTGCQDRPMPATIL
jgi:hypothetical protein